MSIIKSNNMFILIFMQSKKTVLIAHDILHITTNTGIIKEVKYYYLTYKSLIKIKMF